MPASGVGAGASLRALSFLLAGALGLLLPLRAGAGSFTVTLDRATITMGESATLTMNIEGSGVTGLHNFPPIANLKFSDVEGQNTQAAIINGQASYVQSYTFTVTPTQPGEYTIPAMTIQIGGQPASSQPVKLTVLKSSAPMPPAVETRTSFLKLIAPKTEVYLGEILPVDIQLFVQAGRLTEMPHFKEEGFTLGKMPQPTESATVINNQRYSVVTFKTYVVPARVGRLELGPATLALSVPRPDSRRDFFGNPVDWKTDNLQSDPLALQVLPLPAENVPPGFNGAVGNYTLALAANPTNIAVGDPVTVTVQIAGRGALESLSLPDQKGWEQFKLYPPTSDFQAAPNDPLGISGTRIFKLTAVPESTDLKALPPYVFSYFDPEQKKYRTLNQPAVPLTVRPSAASLPPPALSAAGENSPATSRDIVHIKPLLGSVGRLQPPLITHAWFMAFQGVPVLAWLSLLIRRKQQERLANNPRLRRRRLVDQMVRRSLQELRQAAAANQPVEFFATLFRLLQEQLGERLDLPASAITEAVLDERLRPLGVLEETLNLLRELFQACNQARYARESTSEELSSLVTRVEHAVMALKEIQA